MLLCCRVSGFVGFSVRRLILWGSAAFQRATATLFLVRSALSMNLITA